MYFSFPQFLKSFSPEIAALAVFALTLAVLFFVRAVVRRQLPRIASRHGLEFFNYFREVLSATRVLSLVAVAVLAGIYQLPLTPLQAKWWQYALVIVLVTQVALWANRALSVWLEHGFSSHRASNPSGVTHLLVVGLLLRIVLWSVALLLILDNLGFNITTLVASLGIGGVAVALAVQNILGDLFSSVSIALDKPFVIGDFIIIDDYLGTVEYIGLKTTRLRSLGGEQIVISNSELLKNRIRNYQLMKERRIAFNFGVSYETSIENIELIPGIVADAVRAHHGLTRFDRAHFQSYGESSLQFEVVYYVLSPDYNKYMDVQQAINLAMMREFRQRGISFAHPIRVLQFPSDFLAGKNPGTDAAAASA
ncbi:MAG: mechanosensitive ion channel family protein [Burkholderiaceae bacterium]